MSRFHTSTILLILIAPAAWLCLEGRMRFLVTGSLLSVYLVLLSLGICMLRLNYFVRGICRGEEGAMRVALTFDDGPDPSGTGALLDVLSRHHIQAAFFPTGVKAEARPDMIREIDRRGHVIGNHSYRHAWWTNFLIGRSLEGEITKAQRVVESVLGKVPAFYRPPAGLTNPHLPRVLKRLGLHVTGWDVRAFDTRKEKEEVLRNVLKKVRDGSIILLHEGRRAPEDQAGMVDSIAQGLREQGYRFVGLEEMTGLPAYQAARDALAPEPGSLAAAWRTSALAGKEGRFRRFLGAWLASTSRGSRAIREQTDLRAFRERPSSRFLVGIGLILISYVLGWPMVGLFSFLAAYLQAPALLIGGPVSYGFSHLVWAFGVYLAGRGSFRYAEILGLWCLRRTAEYLLDDHAIDTAKPAGRGADTAPKER